MQTRSQTRNKSYTQTHTQPTPSIMIRRSARLQQQTNNIIHKSHHLYDVNIDFDEASREWRTNKISLGNGTYTYIALESN